MWYRQCDIDNQCRFQISKRGIPDASKKIEYIPQIGGFWRMLRSTTDLVGCASNEVAAVCEYSSTKCFDEEGKPVQKEKAAGG
jgi:hypothetical protein